MTKKQEEVVRPVGFRFDEAPASVNVKMTSAGGFDVMLTLRDEDEFELMDRLTGIMEGLVAKGFKATVSGVSRNTSGGASEEEYTGTATELLAETREGKTYWTLKVAPAFVKFGVRVWPEVLKEAGLTVEVLDPSQVYQFVGDPKATVYITKNEKGQKRYKVTHLEECLLKGAEEEKIPGF